MVPMLAKVAGEYGVPVISSGGFDSLTAKHDLFREIQAATEDFDAPSAEILHIGDHDPSGVHVFFSLAEDIEAMCADDGTAEPVFTRLAVTAEQARDLKLPTAPPKPTDKRAFAGQTVQAEAIPPDVLAEIVRDAIVSRQDGKIREDLLREESEARHDLLEFLEHLK